MVKEKQAKEKEEKPQAFCRLCDKPYLNANSSRANLFNNKRDPSKPTWISQLKTLGFTLQESPIQSNNSICKPCQTSVTNVIKSLQQLGEWRDKFGKHDGSNRKRASDGAEALESKRSKTDFQQSDADHDDIYSIQNSTIEMISEKCKREIETLERCSSITNVDPELLASMNDAALCEEYDHFCPVLSSVLKTAIGQDSLYPRLMIYGILFKAKFPKSRSCILTHRNDQLLMAAGARKKVFKWFNKFALTNSYTTALRKNKALAKSHDAVVLAWKKIKEQIAEDIIAKNEDISPEELRDEVAKVLADEYDIVGDNIDFEVISGHQSKENKNKSLHWFHIMAVKSRVHSSKDKRNQEFYENFDIIAGPKSQDLMKENFKVFVMRVLVTYLPAFQSLKKNVCDHIPHDFQKEMEEKSEVVPLGLIFKNENVSAEMAEILTKLQKKYVPKIKHKGEDVIVEKIPVGGDQLTEERIINCLRAFLDGTTEWDQLVALCPQFEDWHLKKTMYEIKDEIFRKDTSGADFGTTTWTMNVLNTSNAKKGPHKAFNAYKELSDKELDGQIIAAAMTYFEMSKVEDNPIPEGITGSSDEKERHDWLQKQAEEIIKRFTVTHEINLNQEINEKEPVKNASGLVKCEICSKEYKYVKCLENHLVKVHNQQPKESNASTPPTASTNEVSATDVGDKNEDYISNYQKALFTFNLMLRNINDCIREGDGERLMECYKFALLYFRCFGHTKYAYTVLKLFYRIKYEPKAAFRLIWNRFINTHGRKGRNVSRDLHLEHLNNFLKELLRSLRSNLNEPNAKRISRATKNLNNIIKNLEKGSGIKEETHSSKIAKKLPDVQNLAVELIKAKVFENIPGREYESFPKFSKDILSTLNIPKTLEWLKTKKKEFKELYE